MINTTTTTTTTNNNNNNNKAEEQKPRERPSPKRPPKPLDENRRAISAPKGPDLPKAPI